MNYKGFQIVEAPHPIQIDKNRKGFDVMDGDTVKKANFSSMLSAKNYIDLMTHWGLWESQQKAKEE